MSDAATFALSAAAVATGYLVGAIPFAYLITYALKGIDIRTVGSGNVGATNVGRVLGFRYFLFVFALDLSKGLLPTLLLPRGVATLAGRDVPALAVLVALATILGHNFPVYLRFRGGKGVATSLGAMTALDPAAALAAALSFVVFLVVTRYVSLSSILGGIVFAIAHFVGLGDRPAWGRDEAAMSLLVVVLLGMLVVRHRKNFARIGAGTEPKVRFRKDRPKAPAGRVRLGLVVALALLATASGVAVTLRASRPAELDCGPFRLVASARVSTGHQRAGRMVALDGGDLLAVACPRYNRVILYRVPGEHLEKSREIRTEGCPVALAGTTDRLYVLQRPINDARHLEEGYWEAFAFDGRRLGSKSRVGWDPDDMVLTDDGRTALVLLSGHAEGEPNRPDPSLVVVDLADPSLPRVRAQVVFDRPGDDPERVAMDPTARRAAVALGGTNEVAWIDLSDPDHPAIAGRTPLPSDRRPGVLAFSGRLLVAEADGGTLWDLGDGPDPARAPRAVARDCGDYATLAIRDGSGPVTECAVGTAVRGSALVVLAPAEGGPLRSLPLRGAANLGRVEPTGLVADPRGRWLAVADRAGGVHLIAVRPGRDMGQMPPGG